MARFKLVKTGKRRVEVRKVRFKLNFVVLLLSFACAVLVWLYVTGRNADPDLISPEDTTEAQTHSEITETEIQSIEAKGKSVFDMLSLDGGSDCET